MRRLLRHRALVKAWLVGVFLVSVPGSTSSSEGDRLPYVPKAAIRTQCDQAYKSRLKTRQGTWNADGTCMGFPEGPCGFGS